MSGYSPGFGNHISTEAVPGALPIGQNSPQHVAYGLYAEQFSGTAFTAPRHENRRSWLYRLRPAAAHAPFRVRETATLLRSFPFDELPPTPNRLRWDPLPMPPAPTDFVDGLFSIAGNEGVGIHLYACNQTMVRRAFCNADGELLVVPQGGRLHIVTEFGLLDVEPLQIALIPRGVRFRVELPDGAARGYVCENHGPAFRPPELGPIGANGLANPRDFENTTAWYEDVDEATELIQKFGGKLWSTMVDHSPFDVVAWHGNLAPWRYDLRRFNTINTVSFDHPDPSIFTVLTSPGDSVGAANCDFVIFPPRWAVAEHSFRPPWFHRNVMSEYMGLIEGSYDAKASGFEPGGGSLHNRMSCHGPDKLSYDAAISAELEPRRSTGTMAFMFETRSLLRPTCFAMEGPLLQTDYEEAWTGFAKAELPR